MTQLLGTLLDSGGNPISGKLRVTLSGNMVEISANPDSIYLTAPYLYTVTNGVINLTLDESETKKITYRFEFFTLDGSGNFITPALFDFYALVPNLSPVQFASLVPTGMVNEMLDTGALRIAQLIAADTNLSSSIGGPFPRGDWNSGTTYNYRDLVNYLNRVYISKSVTPIVGVLPTDTTNWMNLPLQPTGSLILGDATPYGVSWNGSGLAASQDGVYDALENYNSNLSSKAPVNSPSFTGDINTTGNITVLTNKSLVNYGSFTLLGGNNSTYYPVRFAANPTDFGAKQKLQIFRGWVHENGYGLGSFYLEFSFLPTNWGNNLTEISDIRYCIGTGGPFNDPVGDIVDGSWHGGGSDVVVWLKQGVTYHWRSPEATSFWTLVDANASGGSIVDSSGITHNPITTQSDLILAAKGWVNITPINGWSNYGGGLTTLRAKKFINGYNNSFVEVRGTLTRADTTMPGTTVGFLPNGCYPSYPLITSQLVNTTSGIRTARVDITPAGELKVMGYSSTGVLDSLSINQVFSLN